MAAEERRLGEWLSSWAHKDAHAVCGPGLTPRDDAPPVHGEAGRQDHDGQPGRRLLLDVELALRRVGLLRPRGQRHPRARVVVELRVAVIIVCVYYYDVIDTVCMHSHAELHHREVL